MTLGGEPSVFTSTADPTTSRSRPRPAISSPPPSRPAALCRDRGVPLALLTNGANWVLVHARPNEPTTTATFDADLWLEERDLLRAFFSLLRAPFVAAGRLAELFAKSAAAQAEVTDTLGTQVRQAVELLVGELSRLNRESAGALLGAIEPRQIYRGALTVMMRLVFLLYAEEHELLPVNSELYADSYSVSALYDQLQAERNLHGDQVAGLRAAAWPRLLATFSAVYGGCENDQMRIPPYGGGMFDPSRYPWLDRVAVTDLVTAEMLRSLVILQRKGGAAERLSYKGLDVEQIGHVYEGLLEFSCLRIDEPYLGLIGKLEPELKLSEVEAAQARDDFEAWLNKTVRRHADADPQGPGQPIDRRAHPGRGLRQRQGTLRPGLATARPAPARPPRPPHGLPGRLADHHPDRRPPRDRHPLHPAQAGQRDRPVHARTALLPPRPSRRRGGRRAERPASQGTPSAQGPGPRDGLGRVPGVRLPLPVRAGGVRLGTRRLPGHRA